MNVHFDDFVVRHAKTNVVQAVDYYPFGMEATSYTRTAADPTEYLYNGGVEKNPHSGYYETFYRQYDASIGRFMAVDPPTNFTSVTPYNYAFNDPVFWNDPLGDDPTADCYICNVRPGVGGVEGMAQQLRDMNDGRRGRIRAILAEHRRFFEMQREAEAMTDENGNVDPSGLDIYVDQYGSSFDPFASIFVNNDVGLVSALEILAYDGSNQNPLWRKAAWSAITDGQASGGDDVGSPDCPTCGDNYPVPEFWSFLGVSQEEWNNLIENHLFTRKSLTSDYPLLAWLSYDTPFGYVGLGTAHLIGLVDGNYKPDNSDRFYEPNIFIRDQNLVDILRDSTENGASKGTILKLNRRNSTVIFPKATPN